ncbi:MAG: RHS domain-containing protein [Aquabacterium sp.]
MKYRIMALLRQSLLCLIAGLGIQAGVQAQTTTVTYYHNDISGTPILATDANGNVLWKENYGPMGIS